MSLSFNVCVIYLVDFLTSWHTELLLILFTCHYVLTFLKSIGEKIKKKKMCAFLKNEPQIKELHKCASDITCDFLTSLSPEELQHTRNCSET